MHWLFKSFDGQLGTLLNLYFPLALWGQTCLIHWQDEARAVIQESEDGVPRVMKTLRNFMGSVLIRSHGDAGKWGIETPA